MAGGLTLAVLVAIWAAFAPPSLGGSTSYVVTDGISMEPRFHTGDLAVVRSQPNYHVGQIVAYYNKAFHTVVLHRIIAIQGSRYVFKGDNNNFVDFEKPAHSQLIGALWLHLPGLGADLQSARSPALIAVLVTLGALLMMGTAFVKRGRRRRRQRRQEAGVTQAPATIPPWNAAGGGPTLGILIGGLIALAPFVVLALLSFTRPSSALAPVHLPYTQSGSLSYSGQASNGPAYPGDQVKTGEPIFTHTLGSVDFEYHYRLSAKAARSLVGRAALTATVSSTIGWSSTISLGPATRFAGDSAIARGTLDIGKLNALLADVQSQTGLSGTYTLKIAPSVEIGGSIGQVPLHTTFSPSIPFSLSSTEIRAITNQTGVAADAPDPFKQSEGGSAGGRSYQPTLLRLRFATLSVSDARLIASVAILLIAAAIGAALAFVMRRPDRDESHLIASRLGSSIVPVARVWQQPGVPVIDVEDIDALARIAEHYDRSILQEHTQQGDAFWVSDESGQFRYRADGAEPARDPIVASRGGETAETGPGYEPGILPDRAPATMVQPVVATFATATETEPAAAAAVEAAVVPEQERPEHASGWPSPGDPLSPEVDRRSGVLALRWAEPSTLTHRVEPAG